MASTSQLITWITLEVPGWQIEGSKGVRPLLNEAHKLLLYGRREQNVVYDETTGDLPFLTTQDNVFSYNLGSNIWEADGVYVDRTENFDYELSILDEPWYYEEVTLSGKLYYRLRNIRTYASTQSSVARVLFTNNPGATTDIYKLLQYKKPKEITSSNIQHDMPGTTDVDYLIPATMKLIDSINDHEKSDAAREYILGILKPRMWLELDKGEQGQSLYCTKRAF